MEEHPGGDRDVERAVLERERLDVADARVDSTFSAQLDHPRRLVERDDLDTELRLYSRRELTFAAADLEHRSRGRLRHCIEQGNVASVNARGLVVDRLPRAEPFLGLVLTLDECRVVEPHSSIRRPGSFLPGALPPSQEFTVNPMSPSSPSSCTRPVAFRPAA